jgi:hypothetical protein
MTNRPSELAERMSKRRERSDVSIRETFRLPVDAAQLPQGGYTTIVEQWRQLPDGQIEFTMRRLLGAD